MVEKLPNVSLDGVSEWINSLTNKFSDLKKTVIDDNLDKLQFWGTLTELIGKVNKTLNINLFGLGTASSLLGVKLFDIEKYKKKWGIWNVVFNTYGGVEWLHKKYVEETLSGFFGDQPEKTTTLSTLYATYDKEKQNNISSWITDPDSFAFACNLWLDEKTPKTMVDKLPQIKISYLTKKIQEGIQGKEQNLDPNVLATAGCTVPKKIGPSGIEIIDTTSPDWKPEHITDTVIQNYLTSQTKQLYEDSWFIKYIQSSDHFVLSLMGGLFVNGNTFAESVLLGVKKPEELGWNIWEKKEHPIFSWELIDMDQQKILQELTGIKSPLTPEMVVASATKFSIPVSYIMAFMKNDSSYGTAGLWARTHNPGNVGNMDGGITKDWKTWEAGVDAVASNLRSRIDAYHKKYGNNLLPTIKELASGKKSDTGEVFFGVYMTAPKWPDVVQNIQKDMVSSIV